MITKNPMQLKAFIKNKAAEKHISAQLVMQNYMLERTTQKRGSVGRDWAFHRACLLGDRTILRAYHSL